MTESAASEPIPAEVLRTLAVAELATIQYLLVYLDLDGLQFVRNRLHSPGLVGVCVDILPAMNDRDSNCYATLGGRAC